MPTHLRTQNADRTVAIVAIVTLGVALVLAILLLALHSGVPVKDAAVIVVVVANAHRIYKA